MRRSAEETRGQRFPDLTAAQKAQHDVLDLKLFPPPLARITLDNDVLSLEPTRGSYIVLGTLRGRPRVLIDVTEAKTQDDARHAVTEAWHWRKRVVEELGPWLEDGPDAVVAAIQGHRGKVNNSEIAARINQALGKRLREALAMRDRQSAGARLLQQYVHALLEVFEGREEASADIDEAIARIESGQEPFLQNAPVTTRMVSALLKSKRGQLVSQYLQRTRRSKGTSP